MTSENKSIDKAGFNLAGLSAQIIVQGTLTEEVLNYRAEIKAHPIYKKEAKRHFNLAELCCDRYDKLLIFTFGQSLDDVDDNTQEWLDVVKAQRTHVFYAFAQYFAKLDVPERRIITVIEYLNAIGGIIQGVRKSLNRCYCENSISRKNLNTFQIDTAISELCKLTECCRKQYNYQAPELSKVPHLKASITEFGNKIIYYLFPKPTK